MRVLAATCMIAALPLTTFAQAIRRAPTIVPHTMVPVYRTIAVSSHARYGPIKRGRHTFYGTIVALRGNSIVIQTRRKRLIDVDATIVLAAGTYSAPLFVGKFVAVDGDQPTTGPFLCAHIMRLTNLNNLNNDN